MLLVLIITKFLLITLLTIFVLRHLALSFKDLDSIFSFARHREISVVLWVFVFAFIALIGYQSYWQLFIRNDFF